MTSHQLLPQQPTPNPLPPTTHLGLVSLTVSNLDESLRYYTNVLGLRAFEHRDTYATIGVGAHPLFELIENRDAHVARRHAGLYHIAVLYPSQQELAHVLQRIIVSKTRIEGASDHGTHLAIYLPDPSGNGLELAWDRPRDQWPDLRAQAASGDFRPHPLDMESLLETVADLPIPSQAAAETIIGHVHLHVGDIGQSLDFYRDVIGFEDQLTIDGVASFVSAGGYHHHLAFNEWRGHGVPPQPANALGLNYWTLIVPNKASLATIIQSATDRDIHVTIDDEVVSLSDPSHNVVKIRVGR